MDDDKVIAFEYRIDASKVDDYLAEDGDVSRVVGGHPSHMAKYAASRELEPWNLFLAMSIKFNREPGLPVVDRPLFEGGVFAYLRGGDNETYTEWSLEWSAYYEDWIVRVIDVDQGIIREDSGENNRYTTFEKAWELFCHLSCMDQGYRVVEAMHKLLIQQPTGFKHINEPEPEINPVVSPPSRPQTFGTWS